MTKMKNKTSVDDFSATDFNISAADEKTATDEIINFTERQEKAVQFLQQYFDECHGYSYLWLKNKQTNKSLTLSFNVESEKEISAQVKRALELNANDFYDVYFGVNVGKSPCNENVRHKKDDIAEQVAVVTDIDIRNTAHHKGDALKYPADIETALKFLPVKPTFLISSGGGIHAYYKFEKPLSLNNTDERELAANRGKSFLDVIRRNAGVYEKSIDGVHDLPRVLRLPYSFNCKDKDNRKHCTVIEQSEIFFTPAQIDEIIAANIKSNNVDAENTETFLLKHTEPNFQAESNKQSNYSGNGDPAEYESARQLAMLNAINPADLSDNDWLAVISACKNLGISESVVDDWNRQDAARYNERENKTRYDSLNDSSFGIETLHGIAKRFGYVEKDFKREWYKQNPQFSNVRIKEYCKRAGRDYVSLDFFTTIEKQFADSESMAKNFISSIIDVINGNISNIDDLKFSRIVSDDGKILYHKMIASYEVLFSLAILKNSRDSDCICLYDEFYSKCKAAKINLTRLNDFIKFCLENVQASIDRVKHFKFQSIADFKAAIAENVDAQFVYPTGYEVDDSGIKNAENKQISKAPIRITALYYRDSDDTRLVDIWTRDTTGRELVIERVDKGDISDAKKITALSARGLSVTSSTSKDLVDYLDDYIDANKIFLKPQKLLGKLGWYNNEFNFFITPYDKRFNLDWERLGNFSAALTQRGSFDEWKNLALEVMQYPVARFTLAACIAPPLLRILGERTFSIYLMCDSKAGKSAVAKFGGSCWGSQDVVRNLRATVNGIEGELAECTDYPFIADEKQLAEKMNMSQLAYLIAQGQGKGRMTRDGRTKKRYEWWTIGILGGEEIITDEMATQGAITRTLSIVVKGTQIVPKDLAKKIYHSIQTNYGWAGQCFIDNLLKENFDELRELKDFYTLQLESRDKTLIDDYCRYIALICVADCLIQKYFFDVEEEKAVNAALANANAIAEMIQSENELSDAEREWDFVSGWITENRGLILNNPALERINSYGNNQMPPQNKIIGVYEDNSVFVIVKALKDECKRQGLNYSKVVRDLDRAGYIVRGKDRPTQAKWIEGANTRVVQFKFSLDEENKNG